jgi:hypothetical protein
LSSSPAVSVVIFPETPEILYNKSPENIKTLLDFWNAGYNFN